MALWGRLAPPRGAAPGYTRRERGSEGRPCGAPPALCRPSRTLSRGAAAWKTPEGRPAASGRASARRPLSPRACRRLLLTFGLRPLPPRPGLVPLLPGRALGAGGQAPGWTRGRRSRNPEPRRPPLPGTRFQPVSPPAAGQAPPRSQRKPGHHEESERTTHRMRENFCKSYIWCCLPQETKVQPEATSSKQAPVTQFWTSLIQFRHCANPPDDLRTLPYHCNNKNT
nr:uncharacterized protein LOC129045924 [Mirounga angustirostris]